MAVAAGTISAWDFSVFAFCGHRWHSSVQETLQEFTYWGLGAVLGNGCVDVDYYVTPPFKRESSWMRYAARPSEWVAGIHRHDELDAWSWRLGLCFPAHHDQSQAPGNSHRWIVPLWMLVVPGSIAMICLGWSEKRKKKAGHCANCSYNLTGNSSGICPECGTAILLHGNLRVD